MCGVQKGAPWKLECLKRKEDEAGFTEVKGDFDENREAERRPRLYVRQCWGGEPTLAAFAALSVPLSGCGGYDETGK